LGAAIDADARLRGLAVHRTVRSWRSRPPTSVADVDCHLSDHHESRSPPLGTSWCTRHCPNRLVTDPVVGGQVAKGAVASLAAGLRGSILNDRAHSLSIAIWELVEMRRARAYAAGGVPRRHPTSFEPL
jgi:hypothetical protein